MTKAQIFKAAHKMAKTFIGAYSACLSLALKTIYAAMKNAKTVQEMTPIVLKCATTKETKQLKILALLKSMFLI